jgi:hypothetical protein
VVWSHNTTTSRSTGFTPFKLLFGDEAITPEEAKTGSIRVMASAASGPEADYSVEKDALEGIRLQAVENINKYQAETIKWRDRKVRLKNIEPGHLVLRRVANPETVGKLQLKWDGPFLVASSSRPGSYRLKDMDGNDILFFFHGTLFLSEGGERFLMGPSHVISFFSSIRAKSPKECKCKS